jgi:oligoendopeptidase F
VVAELLEEKPGVLERYLEFLSNGSKYDPITTLAKLGVDMTTTQVFEDFLDVFAGLVDEYERLLLSEGMITR